jgi:peptide/nickel transport system permease protein
MLTYISRRLLLAIPLILVGSFLCFSAVRLTFDPTARLANARDRGAVERERERLGLNDPIPVQYKEWAVDFVQGDWGRSERTREDVSDMVSRALGYTLQLILWGIAASFVAAVSIGVFSAVKQYSIPDYTFTALSFVGLAMPPFVFGLIAIQIFAVGPVQWWGWEEPPLKFVNLHSAGQSGINLDYLQHLVLPVATLTVQIIASWSRFQRTAMLDVLHSDYVRTARAKGVPRRQVIFKHAFRNALIPLVTVMAVDIGLLFGGLIITEFIFSVPGMGRLFYESLLYGDATTLTAWMVVTAVFVVLFNLLADVLYGVLDPRIRLS